jgi:hypothetical protein
VTSPADPPIPVPEHLRPLSFVQLGPEDLRVNISTEEHRAVARLLDQEQLAGQMFLTHREGSPWLEIDVASSRTAALAESTGFVPPGVSRYALWRYTCAVYRLGPDGAVEDDPIIEGIDRP